MDIMRVLISKLQDDDILYTPKQRKRFTIKQISADGIRILIGKEKNTFIPADCLNGIYDFLKDKGWVEVGAMHNNICKSGTLEEYVKSSKPEKTNVGNYVASILEDAEIVEIDRKIPNKVRLAKNE